MELKKIISFVLSFIIAFSVFAVIPVISNPIDVKAESVIEKTEELEPENWYEIDTWNGGDGIYWGIVDSTLIIKGNGAIPSFSQPQPYSSYYTAPWWDCSITKVIIREGITGIGENAFNADSYIEYHVPLMCSCDCHYSGYEYCENCSYEDCYDYWEEIYESGMNITEVILPNSLKSIAQGAFCYCDSIESMTLPFIGREPTEDEWDWNDYTMLGYIFTPTYQSGSDFDDPLGGSYNEPYVSNDYVPDSLKTIIITDACEVISYDALMGCNNIENITLPDKPIKISARAFSDTKWYYNQPSGLIYINKVLYGYKGTCPENIVVKDGTLSITSSCFYGTKLKSITIPDSVKIAGACTFYDCTNLTNVYLGNGIDNIGISIFSNCTSLESIEIPDSITVIESSAFNNCSALSNVSFGNNIVEIRDSAFSNCTSLNNITLPDGLKSIGTSVFSGCTTIEKINIPDTTETIGSGAFQDCTALAEITIPESVISVTSSSFKNTAIYNNQTEDLIYISNILLGYRDTCPETIEVKAGTRIIAASAFSNCKDIKTVSIPNTVGIVCSSAFYNCTSITSISISDSITRIDSNAFYNCSALTGVYITDLEAWCNIDFTNETSNPLYYAKKLYLNNNLITELTIPENIKTIKPYVFCNCTSILSISVPDSILSIGLSSFKGCSSLQSIKLPFIGSGDEKATHLGYLFGAQDYDDVSYYSGGSYINYVPATLKTVTVSDKCETIGDYAFYNCNNISEFNIGKTVKSIGEFSFYQCSKLTSITIPNSVTDIGDYALSNCASLTDITIPNSVTNLGAGVFSSCTSLTDITIPNSITTIKKSTFSRCAKLINVTIPNSVISIGEYAFSGCSSLPTVIIPNSVTEIGSYTFYNCTNLAEITLCEKINSIGIDAFYNCSALKVIRIPDLSSWLKISFNNNYSNPTCYNGKLYVGGETLSGKLVVPEDVTSIGSYAFYNNTAITEVTFNSKLTSVGNYAFSGCTNITKVHSKSLGDWCGISFGNTTANPVYYGKLYVNGFEISENLIIPEDVKKIGAYTFIKQSQITDITIPDSVESIGFSAFNECTSVQKITLPFIGSGSSSTHLGYIFGATNSYYNDDYVPSTLTNVVISDKCKSIGYGAFYYCQNLKNVIISDGVKSIGKDAFYYCTALTEISLPDSITRIGNYAFYNCSALNAINIPKSVTEIDYDAFYNCSALTGVYITDLGAWCNIEFGSSESNPLYYAKKLYLNNGLVTKIDIPDGIKEIHSYAFYNCTNITDVTIPDSVTHIGYYAFYGCTGLKNITIPNSVTKIENSILSGCSAIETITLPFIGDGTESYTNFNYIFGGYSYSSNSDYVPSSLKKVVISGNCEKIYSNCFQNCANLEEIVLPESLKIIQVSAFSGCTSLSKITIPSGVTTIGESAFYGCTSLLKISIPNGVTNIGKTAFYDCTSISEIYLPDSIKTVGENAFHNTLWYNNLYSGLVYINNVLYGYKNTCPTTIAVKDGTVAIADSAFKNCTSITTVSIPTSISIIPSSAFYNCTSINSVTLSEGLKEIKNQAFYNCWRLKNLTIPNGVTYINYQAFYGCGMSNLVLPDSLNNISSRAFERSSLSSIVIPSGIKNIGYEAFYYCQSLKNVTISDGVTSIGDNAFYYCTALTQISLPDSITSIGSWAFYDCNSLTEINLPDSITTIKDHAFYSSGLKNISIPKGITTISESTFDSCTSLTSVVIPGNVKTIGRFAFDGCDNLSNAIIKEGVETISDYAFRFCGNLTKITIPTSVIKIGNSAFDFCYDLSAIYYTGTSEQWSKISIGTNNNYLYNATKYYNRCNCSGQLTWYDYTAPTCTEEGNVEYYLCSLCEKYFTSDKNELDSVIIEATGHSYKSVYTPPTCIQQGNTTYTCETCQYSYVDIIEKLGHDFAEVFTIDISATDFNDGSKSKHCSRCDEVTEVTVIPRTSIEFGYCGENAKWAVREDGTLSITGNGAIKNYGSTGATPWYNHSDIIKDIEIAEGITHIGHYCFRSLTNLETVKCDNHNITLSSYYVFANRTVTFYGLGGGTLEEYTNANDYILIKPENPLTAINPVLLHKNSHSVTLTAVEGYEYSINGIIWKKSNVFENLLPNTEYTFYQRIAEDIYGASAKSEPLKITTPKIPDAPQIKEISGNSLILTTINGYEYSLNKTDWQSGGVFANLKYDKIYSVYTRFAPDDIIPEPTISTPTKFIIVSAPKIQLIGATKLIVKYFEDYEYSIDGVIWQSSNIFTELIPEFDYIVYQRYTGSEIYTMESLGTSFITNGQDEVDTTPDSSNLVTLRKALLNDFNDMSLDYNADGEVNIIDLVRLKKFLVGIDVPLGSQNTETQTVELLSQPAYVEQKIK